MIKKPASALNFVNSELPLPTIEVDSRSIDDAGFDFSQVVLQALTQLAEKNASLRATIYLYGTSSVNFLEPSWSDFLLVAGPEKVLDALGDGFARLPTVKSRFSEHVLASNASRLFHIEDGVVWEKEDADTWYSLGQTAAQLATEIQLSGIEVDPVEEDQLQDEPAYELEAPDNHDAEQLVTSVLQKAARYRAARSDAKVSSIRAAIEQVFGLPQGSVLLCGPDRRALRGDARIKTLRNRWREV